MKAAIFQILATLIFAFPHMPLHSQVSMPEANWDRAMAVDTIRTSSTQAMLRPLYQLARAGDNRELLDSLSSIEQDPELADPVRDYVIFSFALGLSDMDANSVSPPVMDFLFNYEPRTLITHADHPQMVVPLFNSRAAAAGVRNRWSRQQASELAENLFGKDPASWISAYLDADRVGRRGFIDAMEFASSKQLNAVGWLALTRLDTTPELTLVAAQAGLESDDFELLRQSILQGDGPHLATVLAAASDKLSAEQSIELLDYTLESGSDKKAALAIAHLAPAHLDEPAVREMMFNTLADRNLGAAAALVLSASKNPEVRTRLTEVASKENGLASERAALAIGSDREAVQ